MKHLILWEIKQNNRIFKKKWLFDCFVLLLIGTLKKYIGKVSIVGENRNFKLVSRNCCWAVSFGCIWPVHATWRTVCKQKRWTRLKGSFSKKLRCSLIAWSREGGGVRVSNIRKWMESLWTLLFPLPPIKYDQKSSQRTRRAAESARTFSNLLFYETWRVSDCVPHLNYRSGSGEVFLCCCSSGGTVPVRNCQVTSACASPLRVWLIWNQRGNMLPVRQLLRLRPGVAVSCATGQRIHKLASVQKVTSLTPKKLRSLLYPFSELEAYLHRCVKQGWFLVISRGDFVNVSWHHRLELHS